MIEYDSSVSESRSAIKRKDAFVERPTHFARQFWMAPAGSQTRIQPSTIWNVCSIISTHASILPGKSPIGSVSSPLETASLAEAAELDEGSPPYASSFDVPLPPSQRVCSVNSARQRRARPTGGCVLP